MDKQALEYVLEKARMDDVTITQEQGRQSLGALGLSGEMALARIGKPLVQGVITQTGAFASTRYTKLQP